MFAKGEVRSCEEKTGERIHRRTTIRLWMIFFEHIISAQNGGGNGKFLIGVRWRDINGSEQSEEGHVAMLVQKHRRNDLKSGLMTL